METVNTIKEIEKILKGNSPTIWAEHITVPICLLIDIYKKFNENYSIMIKDQFLDKDKIHIIFKVKGAV